MAQAAPADANVPTDGVLGPGRSARRRIADHRRAARADGARALAPAGGDQPHNNLQPYLTFYFCIALQGVFPPRT